MTDAVALAQELIRASGGSGEESAAADVVERTMLALGYRDVARTKHGSVVGVIGPAGERPSLLFDGHLDVVPVAGTWSVDPFGAEIVDGRLYGRGATDMKGGLAAALVGAASAARSGQLRAPVAVSATVLEETVEGVALAEVLDRLQPLHVVICEPSDLQIQVGQRGRAEIRVTATGVPAHAAHPDRGVNATVLIALAIIELERLKPTVDPLLGAGILVPTDIITSPYPSISMLPESASVRFDRRTVSGESLADVVSSIRDTVDRVDPTAFRVEVTADEVISYTGHREKPQRFLPSWVIIPDHPLVQAAQRASEHVLGHSRLGTYGFCTNGSESAGRRGLATIGLGPGREQDAHTADESVSVEQVRQAVDMYRQLILEMGPQ